MKPVKRTSSLPPRRSRMLCGATPREINFRYLFAGLVMLLITEPIGDVVLGSPNDGVFGVLLSLVVLAAACGEREEPPGPGGVGR